MMQATIHQVCDCGGSDTHDRIGGAPVYFDSSIFLGDRATSKDDIVDTACDFPGVFRLQNPTVTDAEHYRRIIQLVQCDSQPVYSSIHGGKDSVINR